MAPTNSMRLSVSGVTRAPEIFECSVWFTPVAGGDPVPSTNAAAQDTLASLMGLSTWAGFITGAFAAGIPTTGRVDTAKLYCYPSGGASATAIADASFNVAGTGSNTWPLQACMVATLLTGQAGRSFRGRMFLPGPARSGSGQGEYVSTSLDGAGNAIKAFFNSTKLADILPSGGGVYAAVASGKRGVATPITDVRIDSLPDIQRRRANKAVPSIVTHYAITL